MGTSQINMFGIILFLFVMVALGVLIGRLWRTYQQYRGVKDNLTSSREKSLDDDPDVRIETDDEEEEAEEQKVDAGYDSDS